MKDTPRMRTLYRSTVLPKLVERLGIGNPHAVPRMDKVVLNVGFGANIKDKSYRDRVLETLSRITGQRPVLTKARKSISNFKIRKGQEIGARVTLRGTQMYEFLDKLVHVTLPRVRDFRGLDPERFDGRGNYSIGFTEHHVFGKSNYSIGFTEHVVFPEISPDEVEQLHGLEVGMVTTARDDNSGRALLIALGFPFIEQ